MWLKCTHYIRLVPDSTRIKSISYSIQANFDSSQRYQSSDFFSQLNTTKNISLNFLLSCTLYYQTQYVFFSQNVHFNTHKSETSLPCIKRSFTSLKSDVVVPCILKKNFFPPKHLCSFLFKIIYHCM